MHIKPLHQATRGEIRDMARAAAERGEPLAEANPFEPGTPQCLDFSTDYHERHSELTEKGADSPTPGMPRWLACHLLGMPHAQ